MRARANPAAQAFEDLADRYDAWYDTESGRVLFDLELGVLRPLLAGTAGPRLEAGVGSGRFAAALGLDVGLDPAEAPLRLAKARGVRVLRGVGSQLPFRDNTFGAVALIVTLCFVENPAGVLAEVGRVLRPGGRLVVGLVPLDSAWGRSYEEKGRSGHPFYRHARFQTLAVSTAGCLPRLASGLSRLARPCFRRRVRSPSSSRCNPVRSPVPASSHSPPGGGTQALTDHAARRSSVGAAPRCPRQPV